MWNLFRRTVEIPSINVGKRQTFETVINEEVLLFAKFLGHERDSWMPRVNHVIKRKRDKLKTYILRVS